MHYFFKVWLCSCWGVLVSTNSKVWGRAQHSRSTGLTLQKPKIERLPSAGWKRKRWIRKKKKKNLMRRRIHIFYTHNCTIPPCCPSHLGSSSREGVLLPEGSRTSAKLQSHSHPQTWSTRERKLQHKFHKNTAHFL